MIMKLIFDPFPALLHFPPYIRLNHIGQVVGGVEGKMLETFQSYFNFSTIMINIQDDYGKENIDGTWSGMIGEINANRMDICFAGSAMIYRRFLNISYLYPHLVDKYSFVTLSPRKVPSNHFDMFIRPFEMNVWLSLFLVFISLFIADKIFQLYSPVKYGNSNNNEYYSENNIIWICFRLLFRQQISWPINWIQWLVAGKLIIIIWTSCAAILTTYYSSYLYSVISVPPNEAIDTIEKLSDACQSNQIEVLAMNNSFIMDSLNSSTDPLLLSIHECIKFVDHKESLLPYQMLWECSTMDCQHNSYRRRRGLKQYAYLNSISRLYFAQLKVGTELIYMPPSNGDAYFYDVFIALPISETLQPYSQSFNLVIEYLRASGLLYYWRAKEITWAKLEHRKQQVQIIRNIFDGDFSVLTVYHLENVFYVYLAGMIVASIILTNELFRNHRYFEKMKKINQSVKDYCFQCIFNLYAILIYKFHHDT
ncbi:glutamate receptor-like isoform X2 [Dermatophagoides farinae]|uniref:glutamate receptor-like isoform X2 n=1 Tax=Dermatophagoides farinae TaxID=6954 RepID=UPI003F60E5B4